MKRELLDALNEKRAAGKPVAVATLLNSGDQWLIDSSSDGGATKKIADVVRSAIAEDRSQLIQLDGSELFVQVHNPPLRMVIVGAVHIAQSLSLMAVETGYNVTVIDPRGAFATAERFPNIEVSKEWPDEALESLRPDSRTAIVTLTHDPKLDDAALQIALESNAFYIGSLGSKKTHGARIRRLERLGLKEALINRIHGPIGLSIGAKSPAEIAVAILAEITQNRRLSDAQLVSAREEK
jgi:xanthine dehydrogenase accessory factor